MHAVNLYRIIFIVRFLILALLQLLQDLLCEEGCLCGIYFAVL